MPPWEKVARFCRCGKSRLITTPYLVVNQSCLQTFRLEDLKNKIWNMQSIYAILSATEICFFSVSSFPNLNSLGILRAVFILVDSFLRTTNHRWGVQPQPTTSDDPTREYPEYAQGRSQEVSSKICDANPPEIFSKWNQNKKKQQKRLKGKGCIPGSSGLVTFLDVFFLSYLFRGCCWPPFGWSKRSFGRNWFDFLAI